MFAPSYLELSQSALQENIRFLKNYIGDDVAFCSVVKGNAYGHGIEKFVPMAEECGVRHFAVFSADEARLASQYKQEEETHVMILGEIGNQEIAWAIEKDVSFYVFELDRLKAAVQQAKKLREPARIHLQLETGMHRLGLEKEQLEEAVQIIKNNEQWLQVEGICTHYAGAESISNYLRIKEQIENYNELYTWLKEQGIEEKYRHTACSAAALNYPETIMDMVRFGIAQYGFWPNQETYMNFLRNYTDTNKVHQDPLERVMSWKSEVMSIKTVGAGEFIGYGTTYQTSREEKIASCAIGYSHGFKRELTNTGVVLVNEHRAQVAGLVNMNLLTFDVTHVPEVKKGDEVVLIGKQGNEEISVASFSEMINHMNYEVLVQIPSRLPRKIVD
jgi:alanine racemase